MEKKRRQLNWNNKILITSLFPLIGIDSHTATHRELYQSGTVIIY